MSSCAALTQARPTKSPTTCTRKTTARSPDRPAKSTSTSPAIFYWKPRRSNFFQRRHRNDRRNSLPDARSSAAFTVAPYRMLDPPRENFLGRSRANLAVVAARYKVWRILRNESVAVSCIAKCFGAAAARCRKSRGDVAEREAIFQFRAANELMQKAGVETVAGANRIDNFNRER